MYRLARQQRMQASHRFVLAPRLVWHRLLMALLAAALACAPLAGATHRIEHAGNLHSQPHDRHQHEAGEHEAHEHRALDDSDAHHGGGQSPAHDCAAYDAVAFSDGPPIGALTHAFATQSRTSQSGAPCAFVKNSPLLWFHSRAPPRG